MINVFKKLFLIALSILITVFILEGCLRLGDPVNNFIETRIASPLRTRREEREWKERVLDRQVSPSSYNIYYFGESTMKGDPYSDTIPMMVENILNQPIHGKMIKWVNFAEGGIDLKESERRLEWLLQNKELTNPSLIVIYSGHNEFLKFHDCCGFDVSKKYGQTAQQIISSSKLANRLAKAFHLYKVEIHDRSLFDTPVIPTDEFSIVIDEYTTRFQNMIANAEKNKVDVIVSTVAGNYSDFEPNRSVYCNENQDETKFKELVNTGKSLESKQEFLAAKQSFTQAQNICNEFAETHYHLGKLNQALGLNEDAWTEYELAVDFDRMPIRAQSSQNAFIRSLKENDYVHTVDVVEQLRSLNENRLIGYNLMSDGHHPNLLGYYSISSLIAQKINTITDTPSPLGPPSFDFLSHFEPNLGEKKYMYLGRAEWLVRLSTWRYDPSSRLEKASEYLEKSRKIEPEVTMEYVLLMIISIIKNDKMRSQEFKDKAMQLEPKETEKLLKDPWIIQFVQRME